MDGSSDLINNGDDVADDVTGDVTGSDDAYASDGTTCSASQFRCSFGAVLCVSANTVCDGVADCDDAEAAGTAGAVSSDEARCAQGCVDTAELSESCRIWAETGYCETSISFMRVHCRASCGHCPT